MVFSSSTAASATALCWRAVIVDGELDEVRKLRRKNAWELPVLHGTEAPMADAARVLVVKVATEKAVTLADEPARRLIPTARQASRAILALCLSGGTILVITGEEEIVRRPCHNI
jgi:hypothetical protein